MNDIKRYDYGYTDDGFGGARYLGLIEKPDGKLVRASDYDRLEQECERLKSIYEEDTRRLTGVNALADDLKAERDELRAQVDAMRALFGDIRFLVEQKRTVIDARYVLLSRIDAALQANK